MTITTVEKIHHFEPHGEVRELFADDRSPLISGGTTEVLLSGPAGTGKSRAGLELLALEASRNPGMRGLIVRKTATSLTSSGLVTFRRDVVPELDKILGQVRNHTFCTAIEPRRYCLLQWSNLRDPHQTIPPYLGRTN
jgi:hypothetical protein